MKPVIQFIVILLFGALIIIGTTLLVNTIREPEIRITEKIKTVEKIIKIPECSNDFQEYKNLLDNGQFITIAKDKSCYASNGEFVRSFSVNVNRSGDGKIACGYLYIKAKIDGKKLDKNYDSIYINPNGFGGHILRSKSLEIKNTEDDKTEVLLPLSSISYLPSVPYNPDAQNYKIANWVSLFNTGDKIDFKIGLSSLDPRGYIDEIIIAYKCWNSETGEETQNCQLSLDK